MMKRAYLVFTLLAFSALILVACGDNGGGSSSDDAAIGDDAQPQPIDASTIDAPPAPAMITITGTAVSRGLGGTTPVVGATIGGYRNSNDTTPIAMTTTNAQGAFTLTVVTGGVALDGYLKATASGMVDTYLYPPSPIAADTTAPINMVATNDRMLLYTFAQVSEVPGSGLIALVVVNGSTAQSTPVAGAAVASTPASGAYRYSNPSTGLPGNAAFTQTSADGLAYMFNAPGDAVVTVSATKAGTTFKSHPVKAWAGKLTTTLITP